MPYGSLKSVADNTVKEFSQNRQRGVESHEDQMVRIGLTIIELLENVNETLEIIRRNADIGAR